jgi:Bacterial Ig-like domain
MRWLYKNRFVLLLLLIISGNHPNLAAQTGTIFELGGQILDFSHPDKMQAASMTWMKMQVTYIQGGSTADAQNIITHARNHGFKVLLSVKGIKSQLAANPTQYYQNYAGFVASVAALNPDAIEVWNEPNIDAEWPVGLINGTNYTEMLEKAYPAIKAANANVMVISGAPSPTGYFGGGCAANGCDDKIFIEQMKAAGAAPYFDCTGLHYNEGVLPPTAISGDPRGNPNHYTRYYPTMVSTYRTVFPNKPLCFTELGYLSPDGLGTLPPGMEWGQNTSAQEQADWQALAATLSRDGEVVRLMIVWNVNATFVSSNPMAGFAIVRRNNQCLPCATLSGAMSPGPRRAPVLLAPTNGSFINNATPQFGWNSVDEAATYRIEIDNNSNFSSPERASNQAGTTYTPSPALGDGKYYWRVRAINSEGNGPWSAARNLTIDTLPPPVPALVSPGNATSITSMIPTFTWDAATGAWRYEISITGTNPTTIVTGSPSQPSFKPPVQLFIGTYSWKVRAGDEAGNFSAWSTPFSFTVESAAGAVPVEGYYMSRDITLGWGGITDAVEYEVQVDNTTTFVDPREYETTVGAGTLSVTAPNLANRIHYWRVRAKMNDGTWTPWSEIVRFQVRAP